MTSSLGITVGSLSSVRNYTNDTVVGGTLLMFYEAQSLGPLDVSNQDKLDLVIQWIESTIVERSRRMELNKRRDALEDTVNGEVDLK